MVLLDLIDVNSLRAFALISHFFITIVLLYCDFDSVAVTLRSNATQNDFDEARFQFRALMSAGLVFLLLRAYHVGYDTNTLTFIGVMSCALDLLAAFLIAWMIVDGLDWRMYIYLFVFCV